MMSPILPPVSMSMAITRVYRVMTPWMVVTVVSKSSTSWLMETFITAWSRTMTNWAAASAARVPQAIVARSAAAAVTGSRP